MCQSAVQASCPRLANAAGFGHPCQTGGLSPSARMRLPLRHADRQAISPVRNARVKQSVNSVRHRATSAGQEIGDANARHHGVEALGKRLRLGRCRLLNRADLQHALVQRDIRQQASVRLDVDCRQPFVEESARAAMKQSKSGSTAIGSVPLCSSSRSVSWEISRSSNDRYRRLPTTQTSPARNRSRSSDNTQSS